MSLRNTLCRMLETLTRSQPEAARRRRSYKLELDRLEERLAPVVGFNQPPPVAAGVGWDGVVNLNGCTGSLLSSGRHILTAAHCITNGNGQIDVSSVQVNFDLPGQSIPMTVPRANFRVHPSWRGESVSWNNDIAILDLPALAPSGPRGVGADRYDIYRSTNELTVSNGEFSFLGYGRFGNGNNGDNMAADGRKRLGFNRFERVEGTRLQFDFDNGTTTNDVFRVRYSIANTGMGLSEAMNAPGDSGGPSFLSGRIAAVTSSRWWCGCAQDILPGGNSSFGDWGEYTRVSSYATWIDGIVDAPHSLVLDMNTQLAGRDANPDTIELRLVGSYLFIFVNGQSYHYVPLSRVNSVFLNGSNARDVFIVSDGLVGKSVIVDGRGGNDEVIINNDVATPETSIFSDTVYVRSTNPIYYSNVEQLTLNASGGDLVYVRSTAASTPVIVSGAGQVHVGNGGHVANVRGTLTVRNPPSYTALTIDNSADATTRSVTLSSTGITGLAPAAINWVQNDLRSLTIRGGNGLNTFHVVNTPQSGVLGGVTTTLLCGTGLDTVNVLATTGVININGGGGADVVNLGNNGSLAGIQGSMTISNANGSRTRVTIDDRNRGGNFPAVTLDNYTSDAEYVRLTGLTPATIYSRCRDTQDYTLRTGTGAVTANVLSTCPIQSSLALVGHSANTTVNAGRAGRLTDIRGRVHFDNAVAGGALVINNAADPFGRTVTVTSNSVSFGNPDATIHWNRLGSVTVHGGQGTDTYDIRSTAAGVQTSVNGGGGLDTFEIGNGTLAGIAGPIRVSGGSFARVNDSSGTVGRYYAWDGTTLAWDAVTVETANVGFVSVVGGAGDDVYSVYGLGPINLIVFGAAGADYLVGPDAATTWRITSADAGNLGPTVTFQQIENLIGGADDDTFAFADGVNISGYLDGGGGNNLLDYSAWTTGVYVDLLNNVAFQGAAAIYNITYVHGGAGDDFIRGDAQDNWIVGNGGHDILVGGEGGDWLQGGDGQDLLFGGNGFDQLDGGNGEDLLFGGPTAYDNDDAALNDIWAEWTRTDLAYADRIATLRTGTSSGYVLDATTVFEDADADLLYGEGDLDWFWGTDGLDVMDRVDPDEVLN